MPVPGLLLVFQDGEPRYIPLPVRPGVPVPLLDSGQATPQGVAELGPAGLLIRSLDASGGLTLDGAPITGTVDPVSTGVLRVGDSLLLVVGDLRPYLERPMSLDPVAGPVLQGLLERAAEAGRARRHLLLKGWSRGAPDRTVRVLVEAYHQALKCPGPMTATHGAFTTLEPELSQLRNGVLMVEYFDLLEAGAQANLLATLGKRRPATAPEDRSVGEGIWIVAVLYQTVGLAKVRPELLEALDAVELAIPSLALRLEELPWLLRGEGYGVAGLQPVMLSLLKNPGAFYEFVTESSLPGNTGPDGLAGRGGWRRFEVQVPKPTERPNPRNRTLLVVLASMVDTLRRWL